jgi:hypothetical protein
VHVSSAVRFPIFQTRRCCWSDGRRRLFQGWDGGSEWILVDDLVIFVVGSGWGKGTFESPSHTGSGRQAANDRDASLANLHRTVMHARVFVLKLPA